MSPTTRNNNVIRKTPVPENYEFIPQDANNVVYTSPTEKTNVIKKSDITKFYIPIGIFGSVIVGLSSYFWGVGVDLSKTSLQHEMKIANMELASAEHKQKIQALENNNMEMRIRMANIEMQLNQLLVQTNKIVEKLEKAK